MGLAWQEYWSGLHFSPQGNLPDPGVEPAALALAGRLFTAPPSGEAPSARQGALKFLLLN